MKQLLQAFPGHRQGHPRQTSDSRTRCHDTREALAVRSVVQVQIEVGANADVARPPETAVRSGLPRCGQTANGTRRNRTA